MDYDFTVGPEQGGLRLDVFLAGALGEFSRSEVQAGIAAGRTRVNGATAFKKSLVLSPGDRVEFVPGGAPPLAGAPEAFPLDIRYEDQWLLVVNKPAGMVVHPAPGHSGGTLVNGLLAYSSLSDLGGEFRPGIVHRLDKDTSGLLMVAKTNSCHLRLSEMLKAREVERVYLALLLGKLPQARGRIRGPIGRHPRQRKSMAISEKGKDALTDFKVLRYFPGYTLVQAGLLTGRTHQIRVHFSHLGWPVVGDRLYGPRHQDKKYAGHMLHARTLRFDHPFLPKKIQVTAEPPQEFLQLLRELNRAAEG